MSVCVHLDNSGVLIPTGQPVSECAGYVLVSAAEHGVYQVVQDVFAFPSTAVALGWFAGCCSLILFLYVVGRLSGAAANVFNDTRS